MPRRIALLLAVLVTVPLGLSVAPTAASAAPADSAASAAALPLCRYAGNHTNGSGQAMAVPIAANGSTACFMSRYAVPCAGPGCTSVVQLQRTLNVCYGSGLSVDGNFGARTEAALKAAQSRAGAVPDGQYGTETRNKIRHESNDVPGTCHRF